MTIAFQSAVTSWHTLVCRHATTVVVLTTLLALSSAYYVANNLDINTDTADLLSAQLPWRATYLEYKKAFPQYADNIVVVIEADTPDQMQDAITKLGARIDQRPDIFESVYLGQFSDFFRTNGLLFMATDELETLGDRLAEVQPFLARLASDSTLDTFTKILTQAVDEMLDGEKLSIDTTFAAVAEVIEAAGRNERKTLSWHTLMSSEPITDGDRRGIIVVKPVLDYSSLLPGEPAVHGLRALITDAGLTPDEGLQIRLTGGAALAYEELDSVTRGAKRAGLLALIMVSIVLTVGLRSIMLVIATLLTLIFGLLYTAAFATFAIGELNLISIAFAVLYIGLGVDFAIHYCLRYRELRGNGNDSVALASTSRHIGASLAICALTTATGFYAFLPTAYSGVAELGAISGTGMFVSLIVSLTLLPALLTLGPRVAARSAERGQHNPLTSIPQRAPGIVCGFALLICLVSFWLLPKAEFDHNPIHLQDPTTESVITYRELLEKSEQSPLSISALVNGRDAAATLARQLRKLPEVDKVITLEDFLATDQEEKLYIIEDIALALGPDLEPSNTGKRNDSKEEIASLRSLRDRLQQFSGNPSNANIGDSAKQLLAALNGYLQQLGDADEENREQLQRLEAALLSNLPGRLDALRQSLEANVFNTHTLPRDLHNRWVGEGDVYRIEVLPRDNLDDNRALEDFVAAVQQVMPERATGNAVINVEASAAVVDAFQQAFLSAVLVITVLLLFLLERRRDVLFILAPLLLAGLLTAATVVLIGESFNFANIIALPLLFGIGVDSAIHILHRYRTAPPSDGSLLATSTARAVVVSAFTTACGFGNLAVSAHLGTASLGKMLAYGLCFMLICTLLLLPSMLVLRAGKHAR